ncbi:conserved hypothetical protein [Leishmania major strain Friedlin]|uniref:CULT domain-containing protein n=1 Tax=Leishmania major TaxID=5664 RepID=Q4QHW7_LEIMA|nr:conserved hypothetical protein [Leishmania major strain Friedlin]CAG9569672.1 hypothetical_protein_-__conserved [Leishmania major strain Friedlin]CAJ02577.1 conserved hypothetical protein [Leishmania major strain Friedlin]|eukprot:XP_001681231.1 conserved hypothetical protein [Leishmania major strain Friedlin]
MSASPSSPSTAAASASPQDTVEVLLCDSCRCPIGSLWDVLPAEEAVPVWRDQVYSYELDLFANGSPPIQAYSATNPSARRFDLLRLAPYVTLHRVSTPRGEAPPPGADASRSCNAGASTTAASALDAQECEGSVQVEEVSTAHAPPADATGTRGAASTTLHAPSFVECHTTVYSTEHSFFAGYAWCFCNCSNCGAFLGWGFAAVDRLRAARRLHRGGKSGEVSETGDVGRPRKKGARQEEEVRKTETDIATAAAAGDSQPAESSSPPAAPSAPRDQHQQRPRGEGEGCRSGAHASDLAPPADSDDSSDEGTSMMTTSDSNDGDDSSAIGGGGGARGGGQEHTNTGVTPDFIGIIITHCTSDPDYPIASLMRDVEWRAARQRRRKRVEALTRRISLLLPQMRDSYRAHEIYHDYHAMEQLLYAAPLLPLQDVSDSFTTAVTALLSDVDEDGVPIRMHATVEAARIAVARQMDSDNSSGVSGHSSSGHEGNSPS